MCSSVIQAGVVIALVTLLTMDYYLPGGLIKGTGDLTRARTAGFAVRVFTSYTSKRCEVVTAHSARSSPSIPTTSDFGHDYFGTLGNDSGTNGQMISESAVTLCRNTH
jgi:hypothetical protein